MERKNCMVKTLQNVEHTSELLREKVHIQN